MLMHIVEEDLGWGVPRLAEAPLDSRLDREKSWKSWRGHRGWGGQSGEWGWVSSAEYTKMCISQAGGHW